jgi:Reverse transcriptase (RNA-dependent DNA polymerase)
MSHIQYYALEPRADNAPCPDQNRDTAKGHRIRKYCLMQMELDSKKTETILIILPFQASGCKPCAEGGRKFSKFHSEQQALEHAAVGHPTLRLRVLCGGCGRILGSLHAHRCHIPHCEGPPPTLAFACVSCPRSFNSQRALSQHRRTHYPSHGVTRDPIGIAERKSTWTEKEETLLLDLEHRLRGLPDKNSTIAAALRSKCEAQIRARRALRSHRAKAIEFAADKDRMRAAEFAEKDGGPSTATDSQASGRPVMRIEQVLQSRPVCLGKRSRALRDASSWRMPRGPLKGLQRFSGERVLWGVSRQHNDRRRTNEREPIISGPWQITATHHSGRGLRPREQNLEETPTSADKSHDDIPRKWLDLFSADFRDWLVPPALDADEIGKLLPIHEEMWDQDMVNTAHDSLVGWLRDRIDHRQGLGSSARHRTQPQMTQQGRKRYAFARTQQMMKEDPGLLSKHVCQGTDHLAPISGCAPREEVERLYKELWGTKVPTEPLPSLGSQCETLRPEGFMRPFTGSEVLRRVRRLDNHTAAGPDGIRKDHLNDPSVVSLVTFMFNRYLHSRNLPSAWLLNRTTLIPKEGKDASLAANCRPITMGSLLGRVFWGLMSDRLGKVIVMSPRQKGFVKEAGCFNNVHALSEILRLMRHNHGGVVVQLDVKKAFDTAPHDAIGTALRNKGIPGFICDMVTRSYQGVTTSIAHTDGNVAVRLLRGVKQGDPLSPLLFNLILEPLLLDLESQAGFSGAGISVSVLAFADDLILIAGDPTRAQALLNITATYLTRLGMALAPEKSISIYIHVTHGSWKLADPQLILDGVPLQAADGNTRLRYLGGFMCPNGLVDIQRTETDIASVLQRLLKLRLSSTNKLILLSTHLIPHFLHQLTLALPATSRLNRIDDQVRVILRKILHLPKWSTKWLFYVAVRNGGLGFPNLEHLVTMVGLRLGHKFKLANDPLLKSIWPSSTLASTLAKWSDRAGLPRDYSSANLDTLRVSREEAMLDKWAVLSSQGGAVEAFRESPLGNTVLRQPTLLSPSRFITTLQMRVNAATTRATLRRTGNRTTSKCRKCGVRDETLGHIIGYCPFTKAARISRHDEIKNFIGDRLRTQRGKVTSISIERRFRHDQAGGSVWLQPDITVHRGVAAYLIDITVRVERPGYFAQAASQKRTKYECLLPSLMVEANVTTAKVLPIVVGTRGALPNETVANLHTLGISSQKDLQTIHMMALRCTLKMYHHFMD